MVAVNQRVVLGVLITASPLFRDNTCHPEEQIPWEPGRCVRKDAATPFCDASRLHNTTSKTSRGPRREALGARLGFELQLQAMDLGGRNSSTDA